MKDYSVLQNRLRKNLKHWRKWARRRGIECFRVYDRDIPEFPFAIDLYGEFLHLQEFRASWKEGDEPEEGQALARMLSESVGVPLENVAIKTRQRQKGSSQYERLQVGERDQVVEEDGLRFIVNLHAYLDTGLFLDHRNTRKMVRERADGRRFLNLFAYTGSFTVYAVAGGASRSVTVDLSNTYQQWSRRNLELNGLGGPAHTRVRADVFRFLERANSEREQFDLIVMDPPSFSNSKKMEDVLDVQRDHVRLIRGCLALLAPGGALFFSNNLKGFRFDDALAQQTGAQEITRQTVPEDFHRHRPHRCWLIKQEDAV
jgi:23S rRNA (cytosine1962-C5)-methyltransferase